MDVQYLDFEASNPFQQGPTSFQINSNQLKYGLNPLKSAYLALKSHFNHDLPLYLKLRFELKYVQIWPKSA